MAKALTARSVEAAKPKSDRQEIPCGIVSGLVLIVQPSGSKSWALRYRFGGKVKKLTLGRYPPELVGGLSLADARLAAGDALGKVDRGDDPALERQISKRAKREGRNKVALVLDVFEDRHLSKLRSKKQVRQLFDKHVVPRWGERDIQTITRRDIIDLVEDVAGTSGGTTANRLLAHIRKFMGWSLTRDIIEVNPSLGVEKPAKENRKTRVLDDAEVRLFWAACERDGQPFGSIAQLLLLTGQRLSEITEMTDSEVRDAVLHLSPERTKNGRSHEVPLSNLSQEILDGVVRVKSEKGYVFTTTGKSPVSGHGNATDRMRKRMVESAGHEIPHWTLHDLRRTCATGLQKLGVRFEVTEAVLNHVSGSKSGVAGVYQNYQWAEEKREAMELWGEAVADILAGLDPVAEAKRREIERRLQETEMAAAGNVVRLKA